MDLTVSIKNLRLRAIIGIYEHERKDKQDIVINASFKYDAHQAAITDDIKYAVDYRNLTKKIIKAVEESGFFLLESLVGMIYNLIKEIPVAREIKVSVEKPGALRFADSVMITIADA